MNELELIELERQLYAQKAVLEADITAKAAARRAAAAEADAAIAKPFRDAYDEAKAALTKRQQEEALAGTNRKRLEDRLASGDESVTAGDLTSADNVQKRAKLLLPPAEREFKEAERALRPFLVDNHGANLCADIIEPLIDAPVLIHKRAEDAPDISPALILSQVEPTQGYGTIEASAEVAVTVVGDLAVDWRIIRQAFEDAGCEASVSDRLIELRKASWPVPCLARPSAHAIATFADLFDRAWIAHIETNAADAALLAERGYQLHDRRVVDTGIDALSQRMGETFDYGDGKAWGTAKLALSARQRGQSFRVEDIAADAETLIRVFQDSIGNVTEAGEITGITLVSVERGDGSMWDGAVRYGATGNPIYPETAVIEIQVDYIYSPAEGEVAA